MTHKVTAYTAVLNEEDTIRPLLHSLVTQTLPASEILVVDGGSRDGTVRIVQEYASKDSRIRLIEAVGSNIAQARNTAFSQARYDLVASIDGGCIAREDWLERLVEAADDDVDIVSGTYVCDPSSDWEAVLSEYFYPDPKKLPDDWNQPSHRSILIRRRAFERVGPFPERLYRSEDSWFNARAVAVGLKFRLARQAAVHWRPRSNLRDVARNTYAWVKSDLENNVNMPYERNRAVRITLRLITKIAGGASWIMAFAISPWAGALTLPIVALHLLRVSHHMPSVRHFLLCNLVDYTIMFASAAGLLAGQWIRSTTRPLC